MIKNRVVRNILDAGAIHIGRANMNAAHSKMASYYTNQKCDVLSRLRKKMDVCDFCGCEGHLDEICPYPSLHYKLKKLYKEPPNSRSVHKGFSEDPVVTNPFVLTTKGSIIKFREFIINKGGKK